MANTGDCRAAEIQRITEIAPLLNSKFKPEYFFHLILNSSGSTRRKAAKKYREPFRKAGSTNKSSIPAKDPEPISLDYGLCPFPKVSNGRRECLQVQRSR
jgi:hypothetical protein